MESKRERRGEGGKREGRTVDLPLVRASDGRLRPGAYIRTDGKEVASPLFPTRLDETRRDDRAPSYPSFSLSRVTSWRLAHRSGSVRLPACLPAREGEVMGSVGRVEKGRQARASERVGNLVHACHAMRDVSLLPRTRPDPASPPLSSQEREGSPPHPKGVKVRCWREGALEERAPPAFRFLPPPLMMSAVPSPSALRLPASGSKSRVAGWEG